VFGTSEGDIHSANIRKEANTSASRGSHCGENNNVRFAPLKGVHRIYFDSFVRRRAKRIRKRLFKKP
jgi:hypothetical protein